MRTLCPNLENEEGLETVLEVPIPEETFNIPNNTKSSSSWQSMKSWMKPHAERSSPTSVIGGRSSNDIQLMLGVVGAPLIPFPVNSDHAISNNFKHHPIEVAMAKYIVQQYIAATGGEKALNSIDSMCATGKVKMETSDNFVNGDDNLSLTCNVISNNRKVKSPKIGGGEVGGFVLWQKRPDLWCLELVVSGYKFSAGSDGKVAWRQTPWHRSHASRGPPRPLRRSFQGLDPKSTANLFSNSVCVGEKTINDEDCFVLKLQAEPLTLRARSSNNVEIIQHLIWGYFSQRTGLLIKLDDSHLLKIKAKIPGKDNIFWETTMQSLVQDYKTIEGINIAHSGQTSVSLSRFGESSESHSETRMEEVWEIEEVDFNIKGLSMDCFLPPGDLKMEEVRGGVVGGNVVNNSATIPFRTRENPTRFGAPKVVAPDVGELSCHNEDIGGD